MFLSAVLKSFSQIARENSRRKAAVSSLSIECMEPRLLMSVENGLPLFNPGGSHGPTEHANPLTSIPRLSSLPGAPVTIYLDFDGHTENDSSWSAQPIVTPVYDNDGDLTTFSDDELRRIEEIWYRVAEDFAPFNVNVTTVEPSRFNDFEGIRVSIGGAGAWTGGSYGGIALLNAFNNGASNTCFVFTDNLQDASGNGAVIPTAMNVSHEAGHTFGLQHHSEFDSSGNKLQEYHPGTPRLGPIMGGAFYSERNTWNNGPANVSVTELQDDVAELIRPANRTFALRIDDHGNSPSSATSVVSQGANIRVNGVIEQITDADVFRIETNSGTISFSVEGLNLARIYGTTNLNPGTNLDVVLTLYDAQGRVVAVADPNNSLFASISQSVPQGVYYVGVSSTGEYGSIGQYTLTGTVIPLPVIPTMVAPSGTLSAAIPVFQWSTAGNAASYELQVDNLTVGSNGYYSVIVSGTTHSPPNQFPEGQYRSRVRSIQASGAQSGWSEYLAFTIDIPSPAEPVITRPQGDIADSFPTFEWNVAQNASSYSLWVSNLDTNQRVIFRTNHLSNTYTHFDPLPDGKYRAWVRSFNTVGEFSTWSKPVDFTIDTPIPKAPTLTGPATTTSSTNPRFIFTNVEGAARYDLWVNNLSTGRAQFLRVQDIPRTASFYDPPAMPQGNYIAWIRAVNGNGEAGPWSAARSFTVDILPPSRPNISGPKGPNNSLTVETLTPTFEWSAATRAVKYDLWVNNVTLGLVQVIRNTEITSTTFKALTNLKQGLHRAFVRGINSAGEVGDWSNPYEFTVDEPVPLKPTIVAPVSNPAGSVENANPTFTWTIGSDAPFYELQIDNVSLNRTGVISVKGLTSKSYTIPNAQRLGEFTYTARVRAYNSSGDIGEWSDSFRIRIDVPEPTTPIIIGPTDTSKDTTPQFRWVHTNTSFRYEILVRDTVRNETIVLNVVAFQLNPTQNEAVYVVPDAQALKPSTYRFWIRAFNSLGQSSAWSSAQTFVISASVDPDAMKLDPQADFDDAILASLLPDHIEKPSELKSQRIVAKSEWTAADAPQDFRASTSTVPGTNGFFTQPANDDSLTLESTMLDAALEQLFDPASAMVFADLVSGGIEN